jgi:cytochrome c5
VVYATTRAKVILVFLVLGFGIVACVNSESRQSGIVIAESKSYEASIFRQNCAICHGNEANGKEVEGKIIPSLRYGDAVTKSKKEIYDQIKYGKLPMPAFGNQLTEEEIQKMVNFVRHDLQGK